MGVGAERKLVRTIQSALSNGPVSQDALLTLIRDSGIRIDITGLWMACANHGIADLKGDVWVPRGWAASVDTSAPVPAPRRPESNASRHAAAEVRRLASAVGVPVVGPVPPAGPVPHEWAGLAADASRALLDELNAVTKRRTLNDVPLTDGREVAIAKRRRLMRFEAEGDVGVSEGMPAILVLAGAPFDIEVVSVFGNVVTLSVPPDAPSSSEGVLRCDLSWLLSAQSRRLMQLTEGGAGFNAVAAAAVVRDTHVDEPAGLADVDGLDGLNDGQRRAVRLALTPGLTWLWGPPGTGKTTTLAVLVAKLYEQGKRVLLTAPTNAALDVAVQGVLKRIPFLAEGDLVRVGQPADPALIEHRDPPVLVEEIAASLGELAAMKRMATGRTLRNLRQALGELQRRQGNLTDAEQHARLKLETEIADCVALIRELDSYLMEVRRHVCRAAKIVAATSHQVVLQTLKEITFDVVVLDEASMTTAALAMLVAGLGTGHTVVAGDFRQLPPVVVAESPAASAWLKSSPFEKAGINARVHGGRPPARLAALTEQYRMREPINKVVSVAFYPESPLVTAPGVSRRRRGSRAPWTTTDLILVDTSDLAPRTARKQGVSSRYNLMHVQLIASLVAASEDKMASLGMITPFAAQARLLESLLPETGQEGWAGSTVHRFQGGERDVVLYDTVDTGSGVTPLHPWFTEGYSESEGARLLNVAASRARDHLVVVAALKQMHRSQASRTPVWTFFAHLLDQARILSWRDALAYAPGTTERIENGLIDSLSADLARATSVEMWLPRAPLIGLHALVPALKWISQGDGNVDPVTIWVEPNVDGQFPTEAAAAKHDGINIRACSPILQSSAVIGDVVWSSTKSLLSPSPGVVLRTESHALADAVRRTQRRRSVTAPGSGQLGDDCGRCARPLVRFELSRRGLPMISYGCAVCDERTGQMRTGRTTAR